MALALASLLLLVPVSRHHSITIYLPLMYPPSPFLLALFNKNLRATYPFHVSKLLTLVHLHLEKVLFALLLRFCCIYWEMV
jgi:hypothetical protein